MEFQQASIGWERILDHCSNDMWASESKAGNADPIFFRFLGFALDVQRYVGLHAMPIFDNAPILS